MQTQIQDTLFGCCGGGEKAEGANPILVSHGYLDSDAEKLTGN